MAKLKNAEKVIWAVDPFAKDKAFQFSTYKSLAKLITNPTAEIEPVSVLNSDQLRIPKGAFLDKKKHYELEAEKILKKWIKELNDPRISTPQFLVSDVYDTDPSVDQLLKYAKRSGASLIGIGTHTQKALNRFLLGSFAETLVLKSDIPLLLVNPKATHKSACRRILFSTDFSKGSLVAFETLLKTAKTLDAEVIIYSKVDYVFTAGGNFWDTVSYGKYLEADEKLRRDSAKRWLQRAQKAQVKASIFIDNKPFYVVDGILKAAKAKKADLIAMASHSGRIMSALAGSITRKIVRTSTLPVWVIHPNSKGAKKRKKSSDSQLKLVMGGNQSILY